MSTLCGADCSGCSFKAECRGCAATCGSPFGGKCVAAEYIKNNSRDRYAEYKADLLSRVNDFMRNNGLPEATALFELTGSADPDAPQAPGNYGDLTEENFPCDDYNEPAQTGAGYEDMTEEDYLLQ